MKKRFSEEQIAFALRQAQGGTPVTGVCRKMGVSEQSFYRWMRKYEGMGVAELRCLRQLEEENRKKKVSRLRVVLPEAKTPNERWSMDFLSDGLYTGRRLPNRSPVFFYAVAETTPTPRMSGFPFTMRRNPAFISIAATSPEV